MAGVDRFSLGDVTRMYLLCAEMLFAQELPSGVVGERLGQQEEPSSATDDAAKMRAANRAERAKGTSAAKLAAKYGVSTACIYMIME